MANIEKLAKQTPYLQKNEWPPVCDYDVNEDFLFFANLSFEDQVGYLKKLRESWEEYSFVINDFLGVVSGYFFGYKDSPLFMKLDDDYEVAILRAKIVLEREAKDHWLALPPSESIQSTSHAIQRLEEISENNSALLHPLFPYLRDHASAEALKIFLWNEVIRNEVVDDEVAMLSVGMQGLMKVCTVSNLWDELGHCTLKNFHTYWLRRLIHGLGGIEDFIEYRANSRPWFTKITTNIFNILLSRPGLKFMKYGWFLTNEGWVEPHFRDIVQGMNRVGLLDEDIQIYFTAHMSIDPIHTSELIDGIRMQVPELTSTELSQVVDGANMAVAAATTQYDYVLHYLQKITDCGHENIRGLEVS